MAVHNHGTEEGEGLACREMLVDGELKGACLREHANRTATESDPHTYYCAECRATFDFHHPSGCTCTRIQEFVVMHRNSHDVDTKRRQIKSPADDLHRRVFTLLQDRWPAPLFGSDRQIQQINDLTAALIDTVQKAETA